jgi:hypothetical protein
MRAARFTENELLLRLSPTEMEKTLQGLELAGVRIENEYDIPPPDDLDDEDDELDDDEEDDLDEDDVTTNWAAEEDALDDESDDDESVHHHEDMFPQRGMEFTDGGYVDPSNDDFAPLSPAPLYFGAAGSSATPTRNSDLEDGDDLPLPVMDFGKSIVNQKQTTNDGCGCHKPVRNDAASRSVGLDDDDDLPNPADM